MTGASPVRAFLGLGSNLGDRAAYLARAVRLLETPGVRVVARSPVYESPPWGKTDQPSFLNQVVAVETWLSPRQLLDRCQAVERALGRVRTVRWGPRTVDLDILLYGAVTVSTAELVIPHPHIHRRAFVLVPLLDLEPDLRLPTGEPVRDVLASLPDRADVRPWKGPQRGERGR